MYDTFLLNSTLVSIRTLGRYSCCLCICRDILGVFINELDAAATNLYKLDGE